MLMFDLNKILNEIKDAIQVVDGPDELSLDLLIKGVGTSGGAGGVDLGMPDMKDKESMKQLLKTAGLSDKDVDFDIEQIEGGMRYHFASKDAKAKMKEQMSQLFQGDALQKIFEAMFATFGNLGAGLEEAMGKLGSSLKEASETSEEIIAKKNDSQKDTKITKKSKKPKVSQKETSTT